LNSAEAVYVWRAFKPDQLRGLFMSYQVGVDLGSTFSAAAVCRTGGNPAPEIIPLAGRTAFVPSVLFTNGDGSVLIGEEGENQALVDPQRIVRQFTRRVGDGVPVLVGGGPMPAEVLAARFVARLLDLVANRLGGPASRIAITHPAAWGTHRVAALRDALVGEGIDGVRLLQEPQAVVLAHANRAPVDPGAAVAVYDLGGATFTAAVVRRLGADQFAVAGSQEDVEVGGLDLDEVVFAHVVASLDTQWDALDPTDRSVREAVARLRRRCTAAKEALSVETEVHIPVSLPGVNTQVRLTRAEFEEAIRPGIEETAGALLRALRSAEVTPDQLADVLLVGGSARIPLITQTVSEQLGRAVTIPNDPKGIVAIGAALAARGPAAGPTRMLAVPAARVAPEAYHPVGAAAPLPARPIGPPRAQDSRRWLGLPRTLVTAVAATVLTAAVATTLALMTKHAQPSTSDADSRINTPTTTTVTEETEVPQRRKPDEPRQPATPPRTKKSDPPRTTTTTRPTTTTKPQTSSSTTTLPSSPTAQTPMSGATR
jgi:molecular chaperone DnaK